MLTHQADDEELVLDLQLGFGRILVAHLEDLKNARAKQKPPSAPRLNFYGVLWLARQLAEVLDYLHGQRPFPVIHRNLTEYSLWITEEGELQLLDFGLLNSFFLNLLGARQEPGVERTVFHHPGLLEDFWDDPRVDVFSFGKLLDWMMGKIPAVADANDDATRGALKERLVRFAAQCSQATPSIEPGRLLESLDGTIANEGESGKPTETCACGSNNRPTARFCCGCGAVLSAGTVAPSLKPQRAGSTYTYDEQPDTDLGHAYEAGHLSPFQNYRTWHLIEKTQADPGFDELVSLDDLPNVAKMEHQRKAVLKALREMRGRVLFADEVGLGKTVEAGIFLKELLKRKRIGTVLIFCPTKLAGQWQGELYEKFDEMFLIMGRDVGTSLAWRCPRIIASYEYARQHLHADELVKHRYDLVILDEVHHLNEQENARVLATIKNIQKKYFVLLSATPMHKNLEELYNIVTLLRPGTFKDLPTFKQQFLSGNGRVVQNHQELSSLLQQAMIRTRRSEVKDYVLPRRVAVSKQIALSPQGQQTYDRLQEMLAQATETVDNASVLRKIGKLGECLCSSKAAFIMQAGQLRRDRQIQRLIGADCISQLETFALNSLDDLVEPKVLETVRALKEMTSDDSIVLVFSEFEETARYLHHEIRNRSPEVAQRCFLLDLRQDMATLCETTTRAERTRGAILVCSGEAGEGFNLQFANAMINFDLPWDPMRLEQRIGRIQRINGRSYVVVMNLVLKRTIEEDIYTYCKDKIKLFEEIVGPVEEILGSFEEEEQFEDLIRNVFLQRKTVDNEGNQVEPLERMRSAVDHALEKEGLEIEKVLSTLVAGDPKVKELILPLPSEAEYEREEF